MSDPYRLALTRELEHARAAVARLEAALVSPPSLVPAKEVAQQLRRSPRTIHRWVADHGIGQTINGRVFVDIDRLAAFMRSQAEIVSI